MNEVPDMQVDRLPPTIITDRQRELNRIQRDIEAVDVTRYNESIEEARREKREERREGNQSTIGIWDR